MKCKGMRIALEKYQNWRETHLTQISGSVRFSTKLYTVSISISSDDDNDCKILPYCYKICREGQIMSNATDHACVCNELGPHLGLQTLFPKSYDERV